MATASQSQKLETDRNRTEPVYIPDDTVKVVRSMARQWPRDTRKRLLVTHDVEGDGTVYVTDSYTMREYQGNSSVAVALEQVASALHAHRFALRVSLAGKTVPVLSLEHYRNNTPTVDSLDNLYPTDPMLGAYVHGLEDLEQEHDGVGLTRFWVDDTHALYLASERLAPFGGIQNYGVDANGQGFTLHACSNHRPVTVRSCQTGRNLGVIMPMRVVGNELWTVGPDGEAFTVSRLTGNRM